MDNFVHGFDNSLYVVRQLPSFGSQNCFQNMEIIFNFCLLVKGDRTSEVVMGKNVVGKAFLYNSFKKNKNN